LNYIKEKIGFKGLVVSDAMDMKAIATHFGSIEATKLAILAGIDIVLMPVRVWSEDDIYKLEELFKSLESEYLNNTKFALAVDKAYSKVLEFKQKNNLHNSYIYKLSQEEQVKKANLIVNSKEHQEISLDITKQSNTIVKNSGIIPYQLEDKQSILIIDSDRQRLKEFCEILKQITSSQKLDIDIIAKHIDDKLEISIHNSDLVLLVSESLKKYSQRYSAITSIESNKTINIAALTPYDMDYIDNVKNYVCIYGATSVDQTNYTVTSLKINTQAALENIFCG
jgi:beta-N-acetylhexosaminidase